MSDTITQECKCCETEDDCIEGLCQSCSTFGFEQQKKIDYLTLGLLQEKNKVNSLMAAIKNALTSLAIIAMPIQDGSLDVATNEELLGVIADSFKAIIEKAEKGE